MDFLTLAEVTLMHDATTSLMGFLVGTTLTGLACYVFLLDEYQSSTNSLLSSVEDVQVSVAKVSPHSPSC